MIRPIDLYHSLPVPAQELALSVYGLRLLWMRYGAAQRAELAALRQSELWTREAMRRAHERWLTEVLNHSVQTVPFYRDRGVLPPKDPQDVLAALSEWPLLSKSEVQDAGLGMVSEATQGRRLFKIHTGGTTGRALTVFCDRRALQRNYAFFERQKQWAGIGRRDRVATFAGRPIVPPNAVGPPYWRRSLSTRQLLCSSYHISKSTSEDYIRALERFRPTMIDAYPSSVEPIARRILQRGGTRLALRAIITSSETLLSEVRRTLEEAMSCPVFDHYGSAEMAALITQCQFGSYHPNSEYGHLEILRDDGSPASPGEEGEIVATGFINRAMPLVRYRMGDVAVVSSEEQCRCGRPYPIVERLVGRLDDVVVTPDGRRVGRLDPIFKAVQALHGARIVQTALDHVRLEIVAGPGFRQEDRQQLVRELGLRLGPLVTIQTVFVENIQRTGRGKLRTVQSPFSASGWEED